MISEFVEYVKQIWKNKPNVSSPLNADRLNHMEAGIENNSKKIKETVTAVNELTEKMVFVDIDMSSATVDTDVSVNYPTGFTRSNSIAIGISCYNKKFGVWYGYLNNANIILTLANNIIVRTTDSSYVGSGAKIRALLMKIK